MPLPPFELHVRGWQSVQEGILRIVAQYPVAAQQALRVEAEVEMAEAKERTPVRTGALRASGRVEPLFGGGVRWAFGGPSVNYAVPVHENLEIFHPVGQAKYLESVLAESAPYLVERVAARMRELLLRG
jgi:hypothetical protein